MRKKKNNVISRLISTRRLVDRIDSKLVTLIKIRQQLSEAIGKIKKRNDLNVVNSEREREILDRIASIARKKKLDEDFMQKIYRLILKQSRKIQRKA